MNRENLNNFNPILFDCVLNYFESWTIRKLRIQPTDESDEQDPSYSESSDDSGPSPDRNNSLLESSNSSPPPERETLTEPEMGGSIFDSTSESASTASTTSNQEHSDVLVPDQSLVTLEREVTRPTMGRDDEPILAAAGTNCENQTSPTNSINNITCVSANF